MQLIPSFQRALLSGFSTKQWLDIGGHDYIFEDRSVAWKMMRLWLQGEKVLAEGGVTGDTIRDSYSIWRFPRVVVPQIDGL